MLKGTIIIITRILQMRVKGYSMLVSTVVVVMVVMIEMDVH